MFRNVFRSQRPHKVWVRPRCRPLLEPLEDRTVPEASGLTAAGLQAQAQVLMQAQAQALQQAAGVINALEMDQAGLFAREQAAASAFTSGPLGGGTPQALTDLSGFLVAQQQTTQFVVLSSALEAAVAQQTFASVTQLSLQQAAINQELALLGGGAGGNLALLVALLGGSSTGPGTGTGLGTNAVTVGSLTGATGSPSPGVTIGASPGGTGGLNSANVVFTAQMLRGQFTGVVTDDGTNGTDPPGSAQLSGPATIVLQPGGDLANPTTTVSGTLLLAQFPSPALQPGGTAGKGVNILPPPSVLAMEQALRQSGALGNGINDSYGGQYAITGTVANGMMVLTLTGGDSGITLVATGSVNSGLWAFDQKANNADLGSGQYTFA